MAPPSYNRDAVSALRHASAAIKGLFQTAQALDDRNMPIPSDLLDTLYSAVEPVAHEIPTGHGITFILHRLQMPGRSEPSRPAPTFMTVILYGPVTANLLDEIANDMERTSYGAESRSRPQQVTVYVAARDRERRRQQQTPPLAEGS
ncbi:hypothetical protein [Verrucosispora sp. WMMC514]|uniref:hypothetical protein n=1 Tax=Verrucosispora sp. WMMC514 TaxID=3015156 RepID=UPI00248B0BE7|nr:hypothetical protein [Verrucosispora sp. WMMC514]WBB91430.1 hypothetical protein O7597_31485 [Verrucosispora sp. WMMC514]